MSTLMVGSARHDENGKYSGGKNGDQDGTEVSIQKYYDHSKGWDLLRPIDPTVADDIASAMSDACKNNNIGYDQNDRNLIAKVKKYGSIAKITEKCDTDCSDLVRACVYQATKKDPGDFYTGNEVKVLGKTELFEAVKTVVPKSTVLFNGDILVTKTKGHTVIVVSGRPRYHEPSEKLGWVKSNGIWYYRTAVGVNAHGWNDIKNKDGKTRRYYFNPKGQMLTGLQEIDSKEYCFKTSGDVEGAMFVSDSKGVLTVWTA